MPAAALIAACTSCAAESIDAAELELQRDLAGALGALRGHRGQAGDLAELAFQRGGDQGLDGFRAGAGELGDHLDGREIDLRQRRDRQGAIAERAGQQDGERQQPGGDRAGDEGGGDVHFMAAAGRCPVRLADPARTSRWRPAGDGDLAAVRQAGGAVDDHVLAACQPVGDDGPLLVLVADRHQPARCNPVAADDEHIGAARAALDRRRRHHDRVVRGVDLQPDADEAARPKAMLDVRETSPSA